jgi:hypothetical protein
MPSVHDCAGISIALHSNSARIGDVLGSFLRSAAGSESTTDPPLQLHIDVDPELVWRGSRGIDGLRLLDEIDAPGFARCRYVSDAGFVFVYPIDGSLARFEPRSALLQIWTDNEQRAASARFANLVVADLLRFALPFCGVSLLHAACVVIDGRGVLLCGPSGAGKSLLAVSLIEQGAQLLADDNVALRDRPSGLQCFATPELMGLTPASLPLFPQLLAKIEHGSECVDAYFAKRLFRPELVFPNVRCAAVAPALLFEVERADESAEDPSPQCSEIPARDVFLNIVRENYAPFHRHSMPQFAAHDVQVAGVLADTLRAYRLVYSVGQLARAAALIGRAVHGLGAASNWRNRSTDSR